MKGDGKPLFGSKVLFLLWRYFAKYAVRFLRFVRALMRLWTRFIGGEPIVMARYKYREALVLRQFRIVAEPEFHIVLTLADGLACIFFCSS